MCPGAATDDPKTRVPQCFTKVIDPDTKAVTGEPECGCNAFTTQPSCLCIDQVLVNAINAQQFARDRKYSTPIQKAKKREELNKKYATVEKFIKYLEKHIAKTKKDIENWLASYFEVI